MRSNFIIFFSCVAFAFLVVLIMLFSTPTLTPLEIRTKRGRTVECVYANTGISCDWENAR